MHFNPIAIPENKPVYKLNNPHEQYKNQKGNDKSTAENFDVNRCGYAKSKYKTYKFCQAEKDTPSQAEPYAAAAFIAWQASKKYMGHPE